MARKKPLKICLATAEWAPLAKTGGLADVSAALSATLHRAGHEVLPLMPLYSRIDNSKLEIEPVPKLGNLSIRMGRRHVQYSVVSATLPPDGLKLYLLRCPEAFDRPGIYTQGEDEHLRFLLLSRAAIELCQQLGFAPDIFHCHDWHTAMIPLYLKSIYAWDRLFAGTRSVLTIHNIGYQGVFGAGILPDLNLEQAEHHLHQDDLYHGRINFMKTGVLYADLLTTVSPTYAREIQGDTYGMGLQDYLRARSDSVLGILNGVDYREWDPATDPLIPAHYTPDELGGKAECRRVLMGEMGLDNVEGRPLVGIVSRLVAQKGFDLMERVLPDLLGRRDFALAVLGSGEPRIERFFTRLQQAARNRVCFYRGYNNALAHLIEAGSDLFLMPSLYEPCGLNQMYSLKYGTVPVVRETGGLADSVTQVDPRDGSGTGVLFRDYDADGLAWALNRALDLYADRDLWLKVMRNGMAMDFSWERQGEEYIRAFRRLVSQ